MRPLYCIIGPSGTGKSTLEENIKKEFNWMKSVESYTTRPPRYPNESGHRFISKNEFDKLDLVAYTMFNHYEYGVTAELLDEADLYVVDLDGYIYLKDHYKYRPLIAIGLEASPTILYERMIKRGDSMEQANNRIDNDGRQFYNYLDYCDVIIDASQNEQNVLAQFIDKVAKFENKYLQKY